MDTREPICATRQQLYDQVWAVPMMKLSKTYGLSDVGLAKICAHWNIPCPPRGHWAKKQFGKEVEQTPLEPIEQGNPIVIDRRRPSPESNAEDVPSIASDRQKEFERRPENAILVPKGVVELHPLVERTAKSLNSAKADQFGIMRPRARGCLNIAVSKPLIDLGLRILHSLMMALESRSMPILVNTEGQTSMHVKVLDEDVYFDLHESTKTIEREPTPTELKDDERYKGLKHIGPPKRYGHISTGNLVLHITNGGGSRQTWSDQEKAPLERLLNKFVVGLFRTAEMIKQRRAESEKAEKARQERDRLRQEEERKYWEKETKRREDQKKLEKLEADVALWKRAQDIRAFIAAIKQSASAIDRLVETSSHFDDYIKWAEEKANQLDPIKFN